MLYLHNAKFKIDYFYEHMWLVFPVICKSISFYFVCFYRCLYFTGFYLGWYSCMCVFMYVSKHVSSIYHMSLYPCIIYYLSIYLSIIYHLSLTIYLLSIYLSIYLPIYRERGFIRMALQAVVQLLYNDCLPTEGSRVQ